MPGGLLPPAPSPLTLAPTTYSLPKVPAPTGAARESTMLAPPPKAAPAPKAPKNPLGNTLVAKLGPAIQAQQHKTLTAPPRLPKLTAARNYTTAVQKSPVILPSGARLPSPKAAAPKVKAAPKPKSLPQPKLLTNRGVNTQTALKLGLKHPQTAGINEFGILGNQLISLPKTGLEGTLALGEALDSTLLHPVRTFNHPLQSPIVKLGENYVTNDPWVNAIEQFSPKPLAANPLGTIMDVAGVGGAVSKLADLGVLGDAAKSSLVRSPVDLPETNLSVIRGGGKYSMNPLFRTGQKAADFWRPNEQVMAALRQRAHENYFNDTTNEHNAVTSLSHVSDAAMKSLKKDGTGDLLGHFRALRPTTPADARVLTGKLHDLWTNSLAQHESTVADEPGHLHPAQLENLKNNLAAVAPERIAGLSDAQLQRVIDAARKEQEYHVSNVVGPKKLRGLNAGSQMENRALAPYGQLYEGAVHTSQLPDRLLSEAGKQHVDLGHQIADARQEYQWAQKGTHPELKPITRNLGLIKRQLERAKGAKDAEKVAALRQLRDEAVTEFKTHRQALRSSLSDSIAQLKDQQDALAGKNHYLEGWVAPTTDKPTAEALKQAIANDTPIHGESPLGHGYKKYDFAGAAERAKKNGIVPGYLNMGHANEPQLADVTREMQGTAGRGVGSTHAYEGQSLLRGDYAGNALAAHESDLRGVRQIERARSVDSMLHDVGLRNSDGTLRTWGPEQQQAALEELNAYAQQHGVHMSLTPRYPKSTDGSLLDTIDKLQHADSHPARLAAVPTEYLKRLKALEKAQHRVPIVGHLNQLWRGGVLATSGNYLQSVPQEGLLRTGFNGINPLRTLVPSKLGARDFGSMMEGLKREAANPANDEATRAFYQDQHDRFNNLAGAGTTFGQQDRDLQESIDQARTDTGVAKRTAATLERNIFRPGKWVLGNMHKLESVQNKAVLNDWVKQMKGVQGSMEAVVKAVGEGKDAANLAADAAHRLNDVLGNYIHRGPRELQLIRNFTPFLPWAKNAVNFVYHVLPRDHPILDSLLTNIGLTNEKNWQAQHAGLAPFLSTPFLGSNYGTALETVPGFGGQIDPMRNTPFGVEDTNSPLGTLAGLIMPSLTGPFFGAYGLNTFGEPLKTSTYGQTVQPGSNQALGQIGKALVSALPYFGGVNKVVEGLTGNDVFGHPRSKADVLSHNAALAAFENLIGGSLLPKNYGVYGSGSSKPGLGSFGSTTKSGLGAFGSSTKTGLGAF